MTSFREEAGGWFLHSGIQEPDGGVARYYRSDQQRNAPVSTEITGYAVSAFAYLHSLTPECGYLEASVRAARFLTNDAWDRDAGTYPFEPGSDRTYFFDIGIIARGLLAACRVTGDDEFRTRAHEAALSLAFDFLGDGVFHPILTLPDKQPMEHEPRWSRSPGCYQLKSALAWLEVGDADAKRLFESMLAWSLKTHEDFLANESVPENIMDRLHAYCYFLEALVFVADRPDCARALAGGIERVAGLLREIAPVFERSDVCAQLLRLRLIAHYLEVVPLNESAAREEAERTALYQGVSTDLRIRGGFWFGRKHGEMLPFVNPVSTAFAVQALELWQQHRSGTWRFELGQLI